MLSRKSRTRRSRPQPRRPPPVTRIQWFDPTILSTREIAYKLDQAIATLKDRDVTMDRGTRVVVNDIANFLDDAKIVVTEKNLGDSLNKISSEVNEVVKKTRRRSKEMGRLNQSDEETFTDYQKDVRETVGEVRRLTEKVVMSGGFRNFLWRSFLLVRDTFGPVIQRGGEGREQSVQTAGREGEEGEDYGIGRGVRKSYDDYEPRHASPRRTSEHMMSSSPRHTSEHSTSHASSRVDPQLIRRWKEYIRDIRRDSSLKEAVADMRKMLSHLRGKYGPIAQRRRQSFMQRNRELTEEIDHDVMEIEYEARKLFEKFTGRKMQPLINEMNASFIAIREDNQLSEWIQQMNGLVGTAFTDTDLDEERFSSDLNELLEEGQQIWRGKHKPLAQALLNETRGIIYGLSHDKTLNYVRESLGTVMADLFIDSSGRFVLKPDLYMQLTDALRPAMAEMLKDIRVPHIYHCDEQMEFTIDDILVDLSDFQPTQFRVTNIVDLAMGKEETGIHIEFRVSSTGSAGAIRRMKFWYRRKAFPKLGDQGIVDAILSGKGLSFDIDVEVKATREDIRNLMTGQGEGKSGDFRASDRYGPDRERGRSPTFKDEDVRARRSNEERRRDSALLLKDDEGDYGQEYRYAGEIITRKGSRKPIYLKADEIDGDRSLRRRVFPATDGKRECKAREDEGNRKGKHAKTAQSITQKSTSTDETNKIFRVKRVVVRCKTLRLNFRRAKHKLLYKMATPFVIPILEREIQNAIQENLYHYVGELNQSVITARGFAMKTVEGRAGTRIVRGTDEVGRPLLRRTTSLREEKLRGPRRRSSEYKQGAESEYKQGAESDRFREGEVMAYRGREKETEGRQVFPTDKKEETMIGYPRRTRKVGESMEEDEGVGFTEATVYERVKVIKGIQPPSKVDF